MSARLLASLALAAFSPVLLAQNGDFHRELSIPDRADIYVSTGSGSIRVTPGAERQLTVIGHVHADWGRKDDIRDRIQRVLANPPIQQTGNTVRIGEPSDRSLLNNISIDYELRVPRDVALNLRSGSGDVESDGVGRFLAAASGSGSLRAHGLHGPAQLRTGSGDITLDESAPGDVQARAGSGSIRLHGLDGTIEAHTGSGDIEASGKLQGPGELSSGSGTITLRLSSGSHFDVSAATGSGDIHTKVPGLRSGDEEHHTLRGQVHGGGPALKIHTGSGNIDISDE